MKKIWNWIKRHKIWTGIIVLVIAGVIYAATKPPKPIKRDTVTVAPMTVEQDTDVTGRVEAASAVDLAVQTGGKVSAVPVQVGQKVSEGQVLLKVNDSDLQVRLARQQAALAKAQLALNKQESVTTSSDNLSDAYKQGLSVVSQNFLDLGTTISSVDDLWTHPYLAENDVTLRYGSIAQQKQQDAKNAYFQLKNSFDQLSADYKNVSRESDQTTIQSIIDQSYNVSKQAADTLKNIASFLSFIETQTDSGVTPPQLAGDKLTVQTQTQSINKDLNDLLNIKNIIRDSQTGLSNENRDTTSLSLDIAQARLDIADTMVQINNRIIYSPINGVVTDLQTKVGETISPGVPVVSLISNNQYQIEVDLPESEIAKVKVGAMAGVTLDAYGDDSVFEAKVISIDPAATILEGVATYKTKLEFTQKDERIKSGMTADVDIKGERKENVLAVPQRAIINRDGKNFVQILVDNQEVEKEVTLGLRGSDGNVEIVSGLSDGDQAIVFTETK